MGRASLSRRASGLVALCVGVSAPGPRAVAAASAPTIAWDAPAGCPGADALTAELARHVDPAALAAEPAIIRVRARPKGERWAVVVAIEVDGRTQERTLAVESCDAAVRAAAFVIAIAVDPARREPQDVVPPPPAPAPLPVGEAPSGEDDPRAAASGGSAAAGLEPASANPAAPGVIAGAELQPEPARPAGVGAPADDELPAELVSRPKPPRRAVRGLVQIGPALQAGLLPVGAGLSAAVGLLWPRARLAFGYTRWFATEVRRTGERPYGADFSVHAAHVRAGPVLRAGPLELPLHVGLELGALRAAGVGGDANYTATQLWGAATVGAGLAWAPRALRGHAALVVLAEAAVALRRPQFVFAGDLEVHRVGPAAFRGFLLVEARFP